MVARLFGVKLYYCQLNSRPTNIATMSFILKKLYNGADFCLKGCDLISGSSRGELSFSVSLSIKIIVWPTNAKTNKQTNAMIFIFFEKHGNIFWISTFYVNNNFIMNSKLIFIRPAIPKNTSDLLRLETNLLAYSNHLKNLH